MTFSTGQSTVVQAWKTAVEEYGLDIDVAYSLHV